MATSFWHAGKLAIAGFLDLDLTHGQVHYARFLKLHVDSGTRWLDVGCGRQVVPEFAMTAEEQEALVSRASFLAGVDVDPAIREHPLLTARVIALGGSLPFAPDSFDLVTANMVVEHVSIPVAFLKDVYRVLRPSGRFVFHTPNYLYYLVRIASVTPKRVKNRIVRLLELRRDEDIFETFYRLNTERTIREFARSAGFEVETLMIKGSIGSLGRLGFLGWMECFVLKLLAVVQHGRFNSNLIVSLKKPAEP